MKVSGCLELIIFIVVSILTLFISPQILKQNNLKRNKCPYYQLFQVSVSILNSDDQINHNENIYRPDCNSSFFFSICMPKSYNHNASFIYRKGQHSKYAGAR